MEKNRCQEDMDERIDFGSYLNGCRLNIWKIVAVTLIVGIITIGYLFMKPNLYSSSSTIAPSPEEGKQNPAIGAFAYLGLQIGGPSKIEDLESLFRSNDLSVRVFIKYKPWLIVFPDRFDPKMGILKVGLFEGLLGKGSAPPNEWDAIRAAQEMLTIITNKKLGTLVISIETPSAEGSRDILKYYLEEARTRLQEEAFERANKNKKFIEEQIGRTVDALTRDRLYALYGQEVEREMLAKNREQFGFIIIDSARIPDRKSSPYRAIISLAVMIFSFIVLSTYFSLRNRKSG